MYFKYTDATFVVYKSSALLEVFYVFGGALFAISAAWNMTYKAARAEPSAGGVK